MELEIAGRVAGAIGTNGGMGAPCTVPIAIAPRRCRYTSSFKLAIMRPGARA